MLDQMRRPVRGAAPEQAPAIARMPVRRPAAPEVQRKCASCEAEEQNAMLVQRSPKDGAPPADAAKAPASNDVWGFKLDPSMCACRPKIRKEIADDQSILAAYKGCDTRGNATGADVEACVKKALPGAKVEAETDTGGVSHIAPEPKDPCGRLHHRSVVVHEGVHAQSTDKLARNQGDAFYREWLATRADKDQDAKLRAKFPIQTERFLKQFNDGRDWVRDEKNAYARNTAFLSSALAALNRMCPKE